LRFFFYYNPGKEKSKAKIQETEMWQISLRNSENIAQIPNYFPAVTSKTLRFCGAGSKSIRLSLHGHLTM
jgi:hypothetical protein